MNVFDSLMIVSKRLKTIFKKNSVKTLGNFHEMFENAHENGQERGTVGHVDA
jgi:hypothetical protein